MTNISTFWQALNEYVPPVIKPIEYRVYHKGTEPLFTVSNPTDADWPQGTYIVINRQQYSEYRKEYTRVVDGKLIETAPVDMNKIQLAKDKNGPYISLNDNIIFASSEGDNYSRLEVTHEVSSSRK